MATWTKIDDEDRSEDPPLPELWGFDEDNDVLPAAIELFVERVGFGYDRAPWIGRLVIGGEADPADCAYSQPDGANVTTVFPTREEAQQATLLLGAERLEDLAGELRRAYIAAGPLPAVKRTPRPGEDCTCYKDCGDDSASGDWHQHEDDPCPEHPDAPMVG